GGLLTTVQDAGRFGLRRLGVAWAGAMDPAAQRDANRAVGNPPAAAALECTAAGPTLRVEVPTRFAVAGAPPRARRAPAGGRAPWAGACGRGPAIGWPSAGGGAAAAPTWLLRAAWLCRRRSDRRPPTSAPGSEASRGVG